jgi:hypothetical protein
MQNIYSIYGLTVRVPFPCMSLTPAPTDATTDVVVREGPVPCSLVDAPSTGDGWQSAPGRVLLHGPESVGRYLIEGGERITLARAPGATDEVLAVQFLDAALAMVLQQRGYAVLHANAAVTPTGAVAIGGESGIGKSTALTALLARGCVMLTDDVTAITQRADSHVEVVPGMPHLHLTVEAAARLGQDISGLPQYPWRRMKAVVPTKTQMASAPAPLRALYVLRIHDEDTVYAQPLCGQEKFAVVQQQLYGPLLPAQHAVLFPLLCAIVRQTAVFLLWRPAHRWALDELVDVIY